MIESADGRAALHRLLEHAEGRRRRRARRSEKIAIADAAQLGPQEQRQLDQQADRSRRRRHHRGDVLAQHQSRAGKPAQGNAERHEARVRADRRRQAGGAVPGLRSRQQFDPRRGRRRRWRRIPICSCAARSPARSAPASFRNRCIRAAADQDDEDAPAAVPSRASPSSANRASRRKRAPKPPAPQPDYRAIPAGNVTTSDAFGAWEAELQKYGFAIIHNKIVVIDPFSDNCTVVTGSHNLGFRASHNNDENMVIVRGHRGLAEAYACHVLDIYDHYAWRFLLKEHPEIFGKPLEPTTSGRSATSSARTRNRRSCASGWRRRPAALAARRRSRAPNLPQPSRQAAPASRPKPSQPKPSQPKPSQRRRRARKRNRRPRRLPRRPRRNPRGKRPPRRNQRRRRRKRRSSKFK